MVNLIIDQYKIISQIGLGSKGIIYKAQHLENKDYKCIKVEHFNKENKSDDPYYESSVINLLSKEVGFPIFYKCGIEDEFFYVIYELVGPSLNDLLNFCNNKFTMKTCLLLADQMLSKIEILHNYNFIHRDINPSNFCIGINDKKNIWYLIDFNLAKKYREFRKGMHIKFQNSKFKIGTIKFASINTHLKIEQSRRDDLESLGYNLIYFLKGKLPWSNWDVQNRDDLIQKIMEIKLNTPVDELCENLPIEFQEYFNYVKNLKFEEKPDYQYLKNLFKNLYFKNEKNWDYVFDWNYKNNKFLK